MLASRRWILRLNASSTALPSGIDSWMRETWQRLATRCSVDLVWITLVSRSKAERNSRRNKSRFVSAFLTLQSMVPVSLSSQARASLMMAWIFFESNSDSSLRL